MATQHQYDIMSIITHAGKLTVKRGLLGLVSTQKNVAILAIFFTLIHTLNCVFYTICICTHVCVCNYKVIWHIHILALDLIMYSATPLQSRVLGLFTAHFSLSWGNNGHYSGHGYQIWLLNCIQTHITRSVMSPLLCMPSNACRSIFSVCCLSREDSYERSTAQGHALLIAPLNEVIHNVTTLPYTHRYTYTCTHILLCLPRDILDAESTGMWVWKGKFDWIREGMIEWVTLEW